MIADGAAGSVSLPAAANGRRMRRRFDARVLRAFPPVGGNSVEGIEHGERYYERMIAAIDAARRTIDVEMYLWHDDAVGQLFVDALARAAARNVRVRVLVDANGSSEIESALFAVIDAGGDVRLFSPFHIRFLSRYVHRTHKKLLLLDGRIAFSGGAGFSLHWSSGKGGERPWHDRMFQIEGPVVDQLEDVFEADFSRWDPVGPELPPCGRTPFDAEPSGTSEVRVLRGWPDARDFRSVLLEAVRSAKERIWIGTPYFIPARFLRKELRLAAARGVDVVVIHPAENFAHPLLWYAARARYGRWIRAGVRLHEFGDSFYHAKLAVVDRRVAIVGSSNLDAWSWVRNAEIDFAITDEASVESVAKMFGADLARSHAVTKEEASLRGAWALFKARVALLFERWL